MAEKKHGLADVQTPRPKWTPEDLEKLDEEHRKSFLEHPEDDLGPPQHRAWGDGWEDGEQEDG